MENDKYRFIFNGILGPLVAILGIIGNTFCILAIAYRNCGRGRQKSRGLKGFMYSYLTSLACADICYMTFIGINYYLTSSKEIQNDHEVFRKGFIVPSCNAFKAVSDFIVIFMTVNRSRTMSDIVELRLHALKTNTKEQSKGWTVFFQIFVAVLMSFALYSPTYFPIARLHQNNGSATNNLTSFNDNQSEDLKQIFNILCVAITKVFPIIIVVFLNILIIKRLRILWSRRRNVNTLENRREKWSITSKQSIHEQKMAVLLVIIACSFVLLTLPANIVYIIDFDTIEIDGKSKATLFAITNFMESVNYSANFYTYCAVHEEIRESFVAFSTDFYYAITCKRQKLHSLPPNSPENIEMSSIS